jgi:hypothetical protein
VPLTLEGPPRTMRGVPAPCCDLSPGNRHAWREEDGPADSRGRGHRVRVAAGTGCLRVRACRPSGGAAPGGLPPVRARQTAAPESARCPRSRLALA